MFKKILCLTLAVAMLCVGVISMVGCEKANEEETERVPMTLSVLGITSETTTPEAVKNVQDAINSIMDSLYSTHIELTLVTEDEYRDLIKERTELAEYYSTLDSSIDSYNKKLVNSAQSNGTSVMIGKWQISNSYVSATTLATRAKSLTRMTRVNEDGILEVVYPKPASPIDVIMVLGEDMYNDFVEDGTLRSIKTDINSYAKFRQYIYPTYLNMLAALTGDICAIPNNNLLAEYTYLVVNKELADKYDFDIQSVTDYCDLSDFLAQVKASESVTPMADKPDALGVFELFNDSGIAIGTYCDPLIGYDTEENSSYTVSNLFDVPQYVNHLKTMEEYENAGYFDGTGNAAVQVVKGDASVEVIYGDENYVKVLQNPFVDSSSIFNGMLGVASATSDYNRALEFILELTTNPEIKNLFQYGICENTNDDDEIESNYSVDSDGAIHRLNDTYMMDNRLTGNVYMGYPEEGQLIDQWNYVKKTNLDSLINPYLTYHATSSSYAMNYYVDEVELDAVIQSAIERAALTEALKPTDATYDEYTTATDAMKKKAAIKNHTDYYEYFIAQMMADGNTRDQAESFYKQSSANASAKYQYSWYEKKIIEKFTAELYSDIITADMLDSSVMNKLASLAGTNKSGFDTARSDADKYYGDIEVLRIMAKLAIFIDEDGNPISEEEWAVYDNMTDTDFENAVYDYIKENYIKVNDLDDEKYETLVKNFICSMLTFTDASDNSSYTITWDQYEDAEAEADEFFSVVESLKRTYHDLLVSYVGNESMLSLYTDSDIPGLIRDALYAQWLTDNGYRKVDFENSLYDKAFEFMGITYHDFTTYQKNDTIRYADSIAKLKKQYKSLLIDKFSSTQYKNDRISNSDMLSTILSYYVEEETGIQKSICDSVDLSVNEYNDLYKAFDLFIKYSNQMRTKFVYTLRTIYSKSEIDSLDNREIDSCVYDAIATMGFYSNEIATYLSIDLSTYMTHKSNAQNYQKYIEKLMTVLADDITAAGYTYDGLMKLGYLEREIILSELVEEKYFTDKITAKEAISNISSAYMDGIADADDISSYCKTAASELNANGLFSSLIIVIKAELNSALSALTTQ